MKKIEKIFIDPIFNLLLLLLLLPNYVFANGNWDFLVVPMVLMPITLLIVILSGLIFRVINRSYQQNGVDYFKNERLRLKSLLGILFTAIISSILFVLHESIVFLVTAIISTILIIFFLILFFKSFKKNNNQLGLNDQLQKNKSKICLLLNIIITIGILPILIFLFLLLSELF